MFQLILSSRFKKSLKKYKNNKKVINKVKKILGILKSGKELPVNFNEHKLKGKYITFA